MTGTIIIPSCPPFQFSVPLKYYFLTQDQDRLKKRHNSSHDSAWCKYCIDSTVESFQGDKIDKEDADWVLSTTVKRLRHYRVVREVKPLRGVEKNMLKHLLKCSKTPQVPDAPTIASTAMN